MKKIILISLLFLHIATILVNHLESIKTLKGEINFTKWGKNTTDFVDSLHTEKTVLNDFFKTMLPITSVLGTDNCYGLFAPQIPFSVNMKVKAFNTEGIELDYPPLLGVSSQEKLYNAIDHFRDSSMINDFIMRSIATRHFELIPTSAKLDIALKLEKIPTLSESKNWQHNTFELLDFTSYSFQLKN